MARTIPDDLRRHAFFSNRNGTPARDRDGNELVDEFGIPKGRGISPLWAMVKTGKLDAKGRPILAEGEIPARYHPAAVALATCYFFNRTVNLTKDDGKIESVQWTWNSDFDEAKFFRIRNRWIRACEAARLHDWSTDRTWFDHLRWADREVASLGEAARKFSDAMAADRWGGAEKFAYFLWSAFERKALTEAEALTRTSTVPKDAVLKAVRRFASHCEMPLKRGSGAFDFGPVNYLTRPRRLPANAVALAVELADIFSCLREDGTKTLQSPGRKPLITEGTPWKPLEAFVIVALGKRERGMEKRVQAMVAKGITIRGLPRHRMKTR